MADDRTRHDRHDPELIAALLDREASASERAEADDRRRSCPDCAALYADLLALAEAVREAPAPRRVRDFALSAADADRLTAERAGEPGPATTRLTGVMTIRPETADHAAHDTMLVASLADHSLSATDRAAAELLVDACDRCAELHADLVTLVAATQRMPTPARPTTTRSRPVRPPGFDRGGAGSSKPSGARVMLSASRWPSASRRSASPGFS